ncbi:MAG: hypothetical protein ABIJ72_00100 [bacterium]
MRVAGVEVQVGTKIGSVVGGIEIRNRGSKAQTVRGHDLDGTAAALRMRGIHFEVNPSGDELTVTEIVATVRSA